jgi:protein involved in polysaccharide export with SLBB domain
MLRKIKGFLLVASLLSPASILAQSALMEVDYGVQAGDELTIQIFTSAGAQLDEISGIRIIDPSGQVYLPYVGTLRVLGMSAPEIRDRLEEAYSNLYSNPVVDVASRIKVNVTGAVRNPGHYLLDPSSSLIDALSSAGGVGPEVGYGGGAASDPEFSRFVRKGVLHVLDLRPNTADPLIFSVPIQSGDWIHIPVSERSETRESIQFWGSVMSLLTSTALLVVLVSGG